MQECALNDTEQIRIDAINLADNLTEYEDSGDEENANILFRELIHMLNVNGFLDAQIGPYSMVSRLSMLVLSDEELYNVEPYLFVRCLINYCLTVDNLLNLDFPEWHKFEEARMLADTNRFNMYMITTLT